MPDAQTHTPNELDTLLVANPDVNCDFEDSETGYSHKDYFEVKWSGHPHRIIPGQTKRMPRFLAEHFAKHLADHILTKMEENTGRKGLIQSPVERPRALKQILLGVEEYYLTQIDKPEGEKIAEKVDALNPQQEEKVLDLGAIPNPTVGVLTPEPPSMDEIMKKAGEAGPTLPEGNGAPPLEAGNVDEKPKETSVYDPNKPKPTRIELMKECFKLGIDIKGTETADELIAKIKKF